jgi:hypothetical protein
MKTLRTAYFVKPPRPTLGLFVFVKKFGFGNQIVNFVPDFLKGYLFMVLLGTLRYIFLFYFKLIIIEILGSSYSDGMTGSSFVISKF